MVALAKRQIGDTGVAVSSLGLGGAPVGGHQSANPLYTVAQYEEGVAIASRAFELGIKYFDTAPSYGDGRSEVRYGMGLGRRPRNEFVVSTKASKVLRPTDPHNVDPIGPDGLPELAPVFDLSREGIFRSHEESLGRLKLDYVDILFLHDTEGVDAEAAAHATAFPAMIELREQGTVRAIGAGTRDVGVLTRLIERFPVDVVLLPNHYSLLTQNALDDFLPLCESEGVSVVIGTPYNSGILASDLTGPALFNYESAPQDLLDKARALKAVCERHGVDLKAAAIQFVLAHPAVVSTIPGPASVAQLEDNVAMSQQTIPAAVWAEMKSEGLLRIDAPTP
ncbi:MAG: aldo/keto reductase [Chloroflexi bacterium]|nr:aldo/keto reductase [Chloroflexota bacterium]